MGWKALAGLCHRVGTSLAAGLDVRKVWQNETTHGGARFRQCMAHISGDIGRGESLTDAIRQANCFPESAVEFIAVGEQTGRVDQVFLRLADHYGHLLRLRRTLMVGMIWPAIELTAAVTVVGVLIWASGLISRMSGQPTDLLGLGLVGGRGVAVYLLVIAGVMVAGGMMLAGFQRGGFGATTLTRLMMRVPVLGGCLRDVAMTRLTETLAMAVQAGLDARRSAKVAIASTQNAVFVQQLPTVDAHIAAGGEIHEGMRAAGVFPSELVDAVQVGESAGKLDELMDRLSRQYADRAHASSQGLAVLASFATWAVVAMVLIALILRLALAYRDMLLDLAG